MKNLVFLISLIGVYVTAQTSNNNSEKNIKFSGNVVRVAILNNIKSEVQIQSGSKLGEKNREVKTKLQVIKPFSTNYLIDYIRTIYNIEQVQYYKTKIDILPDNNPEKEASKYKVMSKITTEISEQKAYSWLALYFSYRSECEKGSYRSESLVQIINNLVDSYDINTKGAYGKISKISKCKARTKLSQERVYNISQTAIH